MAKSLSESVLKNENNTLIFDQENEILKPLLNELDLIGDSTIKNFVRSLLLKAEPFWVSPASMFDDIHPADELNEGGLVLHTKRVVRTVVYLTNTFDCSKDDLDVLIAAAILHDVTKAMWNLDKSSVIHDVMHPYTVDAFSDWSRLEDKSKADSGQSHGLDISEDNLNLILRLIRCSHGYWSTIPETIPVSNLEKILHIADLVATNIHYIVDGTEIVEERWKIVIPE